MERKKRINNAFYETLKGRWYESDDHPIALLRAENRVRNPWIASEIKKPSRILDIGCGGGLLTQHLLREGHEVHGVDLSASSLEEARKRDVDARISYQLADAVNLPYEDRSFDVVCAMDLLEHVEHPADVIREASRVLKPGGQFFFHTFSRNWLSYLIIIKGVEWCVRNTPENLHVYSMFINPSELKEMCTANGMEVEQLMGFRPDFKTKAFWNMLLTRRVPEEFQFIFTSSLQTGYCGKAVSKDF